MSQEERFDVTKIIMNDDDKTLYLEYDCNMKKLDIVCDTIGSSFRAGLICDIEVTDKFGKVLDHFGIQDGETRTMSSNHQIIKDLINMIMAKFSDSCF